MCNTGKAASQGLPLQLLLTLVVCAGALAVHFVAEELAPMAIGPGIDLAEQGGLAHLVAEHCEDNFIFPFQVHLAVERRAADLQLALATEPHSFLISPLLPPPNS